MPPLKQLLSSSTTHLPGVGVAHPEPLPSLLLETGPSIQAKEDFQQATLLVWETAFRQRTKKDYAEERAGNEYLKDVQKIMATLHFHFIFETPTIQAVLQREHPS